MKCSADVIDEMIKTELKPAKLKTFDYHPNLWQHVGLDYCWDALLPAPPSKIVRFIIFRDPIDRIISAYNYGIDYSTGQKYNKRNRRCKRAKTLTEYLQNCPEAVDNGYAQMLDPVGMDLNTSLERLKTTIVGMTDTLVASHKLIFASLCKPEYGEMKIPWKNKSKKTQEQIKERADRRNLTALQKELLLQNTEKDRIIYSAARKIYALQMAQLENKERSPET
eukprot:CAMPEP_0204823358 /NCGR_PEP_ID=MMETSP1346-20131115/1400_1 /ASSEMBLY_ACC=CAM_ASM_000771 /TAXON_ID=215587 /ORGANISM="Aplanochytrium stocchinoi, Strain GSBS06" /LENGTH=222 /DNA_ID=CAMNT_0051949947 /DNA_START=578 /DNA_END=1246 /DNA_ORIENTATION=+